MGDTLSYRKDGGWKDLVIPVTNGGTGVNTELDFTNKIDGIVDNNSKLVTLKDAWDNRVHSMTVKFPEVTITEKPTVLTGASILSQAGNKLSVYSEGIVCQQDGVIVASGGFNVQAVQAGDSLQGYLTRNSNGQVYNLYSSYTKAYHMNTNPVAWANFAVPVQWHFGFQQEHIFI